MRFINWHRNTHFTMAHKISVDPKQLKNSITVSSKNEPVFLKTAPNRKLIVSLSDNEGRVIRYAHRWLRYLCGAIGHSITASTVQQYANSIKYFCDWIEASRPYPSLSVDEVLRIVIRDDISAWHDYQVSKSSISNATLHSREAALKEFLTWLTSSEGGHVRLKENSPWGKSNELDYIARKGNKKSPKIITHEHVISILLSMHNECERCMFHVQYDTGLRISELIALRRSDLPPESIYADQNFEFLPLYIRGSKGRATGVKERITLISRACLNRIRKYHNSLDYKFAPGWKINDPNKPAFLTSNNKVWSSRNASKQFKSAVTRSGVGDDFSTHWMRHGTAFSVLKSDIGKDIEDKMLTLQKMLGHSSINTTEIYTQISPALLTQLGHEGLRQNRLHEAEEIRRMTYLPPGKHTEKRGHKLD